MKRLCYELPSVEAPAMEGKLRSAVAFYLATRPAAAAVVVMADLAVRVVD